MKLGLNVQAPPHAPPVMLRASAKPVFRLRLRWPLLLAGLFCLAFWTGVFFGVRWLMH